jgi:hypothetical protein
MFRKLSTPFLLTILCEVTPMPLSAESPHWDVTTEQVGEVRVHPRLGPPFWGYHQPIVVRSGKRLYAGIMEPWGETDPEKQWHLFERSEKGWRRIYTSPQEQRLNQPPVLLADREGRVHVFAWQKDACNHFRFDPGEGDEPVLHERLDLGPNGLWPYAGGAFNTDGDLLVISSTYPAHLYAFQPRGGDWVLGTAVSHPPRPNTLTKHDTHCYPFVTLSGRQAHIFSTQDVADPEKVEQKASFVYVFRTLDLYYSPDVPAAPFQKRNVVNVEKSKGWAHNDDLLLDRSGRIHLLYRFGEGDGSPPSPLMHAFGPPGGPLTHRVLAPQDGGPLGESRLYEAPDGALYVVGPQGPQLVAARLSEDGALAEGPVSLGISPFTRNYTATRIFLVPARAIAAGSPFLEGLYQEQAEEGKTTIRYFRAVPSGPASGE